jgi:hypothetical protein
MGFGQLKSVADRFRGTRKGKDFFVHRRIELCLFAFRMLIKLVSIPTRKSASRKCMKSLTSLAGPQSGHDSGVSGLGDLETRSGALWRGKGDTMNSRSIGSLVYVLVLLGLAAEVSASSWTCRNADLVRHVVVFYPEAPARIPCKVFYTKPNENVLPRALWHAENKENYCEQKAAEFIERLGSMGWRCVSDGPEAALIGLDGASEVAGTRGPSPHRK